MKLSITTDYVTNRGDPSPYLRRIGASAFDSIHWCHEWNTDYLYTPADVERIRGQLEALGLRLLDLHASHGARCSWGSPDESLRTTAVALIANRIEATAALGGRAVVLHLPHRPQNEGEVAAYRRTIRRSLDDLRTLVSRTQVRIALENMPDDDFAELRELFAEYDRTFLGLCYDSGHGNIGQCGLTHLEELGERLIAVHLHDNDGHSDQHNLPFTGTVDWAHLARILAASAYDGWINLESNMRGQAINEGEYLHQAWEAAARLHQMVSNP